jgi:hypothetical protein
MTSFNETLFFVGTPDIKIEVDYNVICKWSDVIDSIKWDHGEIKEVKITSISEYPLPIVASHLKYMVSKLTLYNVGTLKEPTSYPDFTRVSGNIANLKIYLVLCLWLNFEKYTEEVISTLGNYTININDELEVYTGIYDTLLIYNREGLKNIFRSLSESNQTYSLTPILREVLSRLIKNTQFNEYDRYMLALKYKLDVPNITTVTGRRLYGEGIITDVIWEEIPLIEETKQVISTSIMNNSRAVRVALEETPNKGLFWLYCHKYTFSDEKRSTYCGEYNIHCGTIIINGKTYNLVVPNEFLFSISDLQSGVSPNSDSSKTFIHVDSHRYFSYLKNVGISEAFSRPSNIMDYYDHYTSKQIQEVTKLDNKFRHWLNERGMLSDTEIKILNKSISIQNELDMINQNSPDDRLFQQLLELFEQKINYYSQDDIVALETRRQQLRYNFFFNSQNYGGLVIVTKTLSVKIREDNIILSIDPYQIKNFIYHTYILPPLTNFWDIIHSLPVITVESRRSIQSTFQESIRFHLTPYKPGVYEPNSLVVTFSIDVFEIWKGDFQIFDFDIDGENYNNDGSIADNNYFATKTFRLIDESTIPNIEEVRFKSNINNGTSKVLILAYPFKSPLVYFKAGIETTPPTPYMWYQWYLKDESNDKNIADIFRSETSTLQPSEGEIEAPVDEDQDEDEDEDTDE